MQLRRAGAPIGLVAEADTRKTIDAVWRDESARVIAVLTRMVRDVGLAEDLAQDALVAALEQWPDAGIPERPGAWLTAIAKRRAIDRFRRDRRYAEKLAQLGYEMNRDGWEQDSPGDPDDDIGDDLLRLMFIACHPVLAKDARVALTLRLLGGLTTAEIARAFLVPEPTLAQRIVRAKRTLSAAGVPFELPPPQERAERMASVLEVIYLVFNEGYAATAGDDWVRPALCEEALRLGTTLAGLDPEHAETHGLVALMAIQASRTQARVGTSGEPILLLEQDRSLWDRELIARGLAALERAEELAAERGPYSLQAAIAACHARAETAEATDWRRIVSLYDELSIRTPSAIVELNRAVAVSMADGPGAGLALVDELAASGSLARYHLLPSVRGDLLLKLGQTAGARAEFERAVAMTDNAQEQRLLAERIAACERESAGG